MDKITAPGWYTMSNVEYHRDPVDGGSISSSLIKGLLKNPRKTRHQQVHGRPGTAHYDFGHAAHKCVLGKGDDVVVVHEDSWRKKEAIAARDDARAAHKIPMLGDQWEAAQEMAERLLTDDVAGPLLAPGTFDAETVIVWWDEEFGMWRRAMIDAIRHQRDEHGRLVVVDYKTAATADPEALPRACFNNGYYIQDPFYTAGLVALGADDGAGVDFQFVFQEKEPPYEVTVTRLSAEFRQWGRVAIRRGLEVYQDGITTGEWPGYAAGPVITDIPRWGEIQLQGAWESGALQVRSI